jgi:hypothetical protein
VDKTSSLKIEFYSIDSNVYTKMNQEIIDMVKSELAIAEERIMAKIEKMLNKKKKPAKKDPNAPKKPLTAFILFSADKRAELKEEFPDIKFTEMSKKLGEAWKTIDEEKKKVYIKKSEDMKDTYKKEMADYSSSTEE